MRLSAPFQDAAGRNWYVVDEKGTRRRVLVENGRFVALYARPSKAEKKAAKRARHRIKKTA